MELTVKCEPCLLLTQHLVRAYPVKTETFARVRNLDPFGGSRSLMGYDDTVVRQCVGNEPEVSYLAKRSDGRWGVTLGCLTNH